MNIVLHFLGLRTGGGRTDAVNLLKTLPGIDDRHRFLAVVPAGCGYELVDVPENCRLHFVPVKPYNDIRRIFFDNFPLKALCREFDADVLFTMCNNGPLKAGFCRHVLMLRRPQMAYPTSTLAEAGVKHSVKLRFLRWYFQRSLRHADLLLLQTETMQRRVRQTYRYKGPVAVIGKNVSQPIVTITHASTETPQMSLLSRHPARWRFLYLAKYYPHKNIERACQAIRRVRQEGIDAQLVLTLEPAEHPRCSSLLEHIKRNGWQAGIVNVGTVDLIAIEPLYRCIDAVLMPSLLESYSATYLEAMAYEKPLLASDREFAREICGDAALYFDPLEPDSMVDAIREVVNRPELGKSLVARGRAQYQKHDRPWGDIARRYLHLLTNPKSTTHY